MVDDKLYKIICNLDAEAFPKYVKGIMAIQGLKQTELAKRIGIPRQILNLFLNGKVQLRGQDIVSIFRELEIENWIREYRCEINNIIEGVVNQR
jgi:DNA-binding Xre family transcriptional regulator